MWSSLNYLSPPTVIAVTLDNIVTLDIITSLLFKFGLLKRLAIGISNRRLLQEIGEHENKDRAVVAAR